MIEQRLVALLSEALRAAAPGLGIEGDLPTPELLAPKQRDLARGPRLLRRLREGERPGQVAPALAVARGREDRERRAAQSASHASGSWRSIRRRAVRPIT